MDKAKAVMTNDRAVPRVVHGIVISLDPQEVIQQAMAAGNFEPVETAWVRRHIGRDSVLVDIGANFGWYTLLGLSLNAAHVFAFEQSPVAFARLSDAVGHYPNVTLTNAAVGRSTGELTIHLPIGGVVHSPSAFESPGEFRPIRVPLLSLDGFPPLASVPKIDLIKIDVEGSEPDVLAGMAALAATGRIRRILCEFNSWWLNANNTTIDGLAQQFQQMGFEIEDATPWQRGMPAAGGNTFDLQDVLYRYVR
jgi:FkbM family methyltransferase